MLEEASGLICLWITGSIAGGEKRSGDASSADGGDRIGWLHHQLQVGNVGMKPLVSISCRSLGQYRR